MEDNRERFIQILKAASYPFVPTRASLTAYRSLDLEAIAGRIINNPIEARDPRRFVLGTLGRELSKASVHNTRFDSGDSEDDVPTT
jgi:hypothetical protein